MSRNTRRRGTVHCGRAFVRYQEADGRESDHVGRRSNVLHLIEEMLSRIILFKPRTLSVFHVSRVRHFYRTGSIFIVLEFFSFLNAHFIVHYHEGGLETVSRHYGYTERREALINSHYVHILAGINEPRITSRL